MIHRHGDWVWLQNRGQAGKIIEVESLWGEVFCRVWLPGRDSVVRVPASRLKPLEGGSYD
ncbi:MAG: hypothetical protein ACOY9Y_08970 [Bacillota bacterium]